MPIRSAGLLMFREREGAIEVFLVHPGGPFWARKDLGAWSIPKGEYDSSESALDAAQREFHEETGWKADAPFLPLGDVRQSGAKIVSAWAFRGDADAATLQSNLCRIEWPPRSGKSIEFPEVDRGAWFPVTVAQERINPAQAMLLARLVEALKAQDHAT